MKTIIYCIILFLAPSFIANAQLVKSIDYRNFYGISWRGSPHDNLVYAKQMGYQCVFYQKGMEYDSLSNGMYFYLETPEYFAYERIIDANKIYTDQQKAFYQTYCCLKDTVAQFPYNLATGWEWKPGSGVFTAILDFQQQKVISYAVSGILNMVAKIEATNNKFHFAGYAWDEPRASGDFWESSDGKRKSVKLDHWRKSKKLNYLQTKEDFSDYSEGHFAFYKQLFSTTRKIYPHAHFMSEPYRIYEDWISSVENRLDAKDLMPDFISQEGPGTQFVDDDRIFRHNLIEKSNVFCTSPDVFGEENNRILAAKAAINGAGFAWFGRFGGTGNMPDYKNITEVPARLKLVRMLTTWENGNNIPLTKRLWDGNVYQSPTSFVSSDLIAITQPGTGKVFAVFLTTNKSYLLPAKKEIKAIFSTDDFSKENLHAENNFRIGNEMIKLKSSENINKQYIILLKNNLR
ncbi:hypothetical protein [Mucilaginibacter psychrotolerans]|uniref:Glycoside hydrolase family 42 N-terminal domain-containing protein n=1 Tax=Mucilaginibacter psychrotolerans TaxID=1524096 RepID=A0A4Y8SJE4_9SPHI|nr:hypothetical protein [Mucilaginibacter psychrotolerans]TFF38795.1 hypothetical protein E2R66_07250 [Mucilaginibacter psychrotolerans]